MPNRPQLDTNKMLAENGLLTLNYAAPKSADYLAFMNEMTDIDKLFNDPRLRKFKPNRTFSMEQVNVEH